MKKLLAVVAAAISVVSISHAFTYGYEANSTWISNSYQSADLTGHDKSMQFWEAGSYGIDGTPGDYLDPVGQIFAVTNDFEVAKIRLWSWRYYETNSIRFSLYKNVDINGIPGEYMTPANLVAQYTLSPTNVLHSSSGDAPGDVLTINLETNEYFDLVVNPNPDLRYYFVGELLATNNVGLTNAQNRIFLWEIPGNYDPDGYYVTTSGVQGAASRDLGIAFLATDPPDVVLPEIPTNWILAAADTYLRPIEKGAGDHNENATSLGLRNHDDGAGANIRDYFAMIRFDLTAFNGVTLTNARFEVDWVSGGSTDNGDRVQFKGLDNIASNTPQDWAESITVGELGAEFDVNNNDLNIDPFLTNRVTDLDGLTVSSNLIVESYPDIPQGGTNTTTHSIEGPGLVDFLNARIAEGPDTNGFIYATIILGSRNDGGQWTLNYHSREVDGTVNQDKQPRLILNSGGGGGGPIDPQFNPTINSIVVAGGTVMINWDSDTNGTYRIESKGALSGGWAPVSGATNMTGGAGKSTPISASGGDIEFFRVYGE